MTAKELIEKLQEYPQDTSVVCLYEEYSDYTILDADDLSFVPSPGVTSPRRELQYVLRNGKVMRYDVKTWPKDEVPQFLSLLIFPGN